MKPLILFGTGDAAEVAHWYFTRDLQSPVVAFTVDRAYVQSETYLGLPVVPFEDVVMRYSPDAHDMFIALGYSGLNKLRKSKYNQAKSMGYSLRSYISPRAIILNDYHFGENCFVLESNVIQPFVKVGNNVTLWSGNHVGHHSTIGDHCFIASHVVVSGRVRIGESCFIGVNSTLRDNISVGAETVIGAHSLILRDAAEGGVYAPRETERSKIPSSRLRRL